MVYWGYDASSTLLQAFCTGTYEMIGLVIVLVKRIPMQITISFGLGFDVAGVVLSVTGAGLRVAMPDWDDAAEIQCRQGQWFLENQEPVRIVWPDSLRGAATESFATDRQYADTRLLSSACIN